MSDDREWSLEDERRNNDREFTDIRGEMNVRSIGPFSHWPVVVNGWTVDLLQALYGNDGEVQLVLDNRSVIDLPADIAGQVIEFIADAIAVARGWSCHPRSPDWTPDNDIPPIRSLPWHQMHGITMVEKPEDDDD